MKMRPLGGRDHESTFCDILHNAVLQVCREKYWADSPDWEVDGVICISVPHSQEQHVVKIHQKFPSNSSKNFEDDRCYECDRKSNHVLPTNDDSSKRHFSESVEEDDSSYRNVSVIDLEHASTQPNPAQTCGQGTIPPSLPSPARDRDQNSHNFYASPDLSGFGPNVHRQKAEEQLKNSGGQSHSKPNNRAKDQEHSSSFTSHPRETTPPRKKTKTKPEEYVVVKAEPDDDEDFALHMECIDEKESDSIVEIKDENNQRDLAAETQEDINFLLNVEGPSTSHQFNSGDRSWSQRLPTSTVTSQMDTNLPSMSGQGSQGFSNLNLLTHGVDIEDGTMRLTTRVQHPSFIPGQTDSNTPEQRTIPRPSGQDPASNTIDDATFEHVMKIKTEVIEPEELYSMSTDGQLAEESDYNYSMLLGHPSDPHTLSTPGSYVGTFSMKHLHDTGNRSETLFDPGQGMDKQGWSDNKEIKTSAPVTGKQKPKPKYPVRDYVCKYCGKIYHKTTRLRNHIKQHHPIANQSDSEGFTGAVQESNLNLTQKSTGEIKDGGISGSVRDQSRNSKCQHCNKTHQSLDKNLNQQDLQMKCYPKLMTGGSRTDRKQTENLTERDKSYHTNDDMEDVEESRSSKATKVKISPLNQPRSGRKTRSSTRLMQEAQNDTVQESGKSTDQLDNDIQQDHIRLEVTSYQKDEEMCRRQVMLSGISSKDQTNDTTSKKKSSKLGNEKQASTSTPDTSGNDGANIQFWCKCGKSFTSLSTFVVHKFPCEAAVDD